jgi:predicted SnoaL-like aldol condensation-catalyzing enzyme
MTKAQMKADSQSHGDTAVSFLQLVGSGKVRDAYDRFIAANFRHHNAFFRGDRESLMKAMDDSARNNPDKVVEIKRTLEDGNFVAVHSHIRQHAQDRGAAAVHIFRFENDRIAEMWELSQVIPQDSPNQHGVF